MVSKKSRSEVRRKKHMKLRNRFSGTAERPRLAVFRSNNHMYAQIIDDTVGNTLVAASTLQKDVKAELEKTNNVEAAAYLGKVIAEKAISREGRTQMRQERIDASQMELLEKVVSIKRVTKVVKGGRNFRFTALVVVGDGNGHVGAGLGKAAEIPEAIRKGKEDAMKKMITVSLDENASVIHDVIGKFGSASVLLKNAPDGTGVIAGGPARAVIEMAGIKNIRTKSLGSNNKQNVVLATIEGLKEIKAPEDVARLRGKSIEEIMG